MHSWILLHRFGIRPWELGLPLSRLDRAWPEAMVLIEGEFESEHHRKSLEKR